MGIKDLFIICLVFSIVSCSRNDSSIQPHSKAIVLDIHYTETMVQDSEKYLLYFYSDTCIHCLNLKKTISDFEQSNNVDFFKVKVDFTVEYTTDVIEETIGATKYDEVFAGSTPQISLVVSHVVVMSIVGDDEIKNYLESLN